MRLKMWLVSFVSVFALIFVCSSLAVAANSIVGNWQTRDDKTGKPSSIITIWQTKNGTYSGKISKTYPVKDKKPLKFCAKCTGKQHNKPIIGLVILNNLILRQNKYVGGTILDPRDGKIYKCTATVSPKGKTLQIRGYIGLPLFGQTKTWYRVVVLRNG
ncbi:MAG: hypothetical protein A3F10_03390 [Coxiella sp. RIFCSPHIGHO2_12_FULL_42_15]|nr:MAG: hypothetical protein A3F10_03390 [Coxiella sp. RIFCSPHIGHO2_12_FULL_42_15]